MCPMSVLHSACNTESKVSVIKSDMHRKVYG